jgi:aminodeoxyfutalosine synthase
MDRLLEMTMTDRNLAPIRDKVWAGERLTREEGLQCLATPDLLSLGRIADFVKRRKSGDQVFYVFNRQVNPTNICVLSCRFCDFATTQKAPNAYEMSMKEILAKCRGGVREVHIVGGLHPDWPFEYYVDMLRQIRANYPDITIKAFTAVEIDFFAEISGKTIEAVLGELRDAGLDTLPGGGAEVFSERVHQELYKPKIGAERWINVHRIAHQMGIPTNATLLYGHIETFEERIDHLIRLRELEDEAPGFLSFIPLAFQPGHTGIVTRQASAIDDLKTIATSRLMLDNFPHIKAYWVMVGEDTASLALNFGADDIDGTIGEERIAHAANATSPLGLTKNRLIHLIREAGKVPVERDARYNVITVNDQHADRPDPVPQH